MRVKLQQDVPLGPRTTLGVGGPAEQLVVARDEATVIDALAWAERTRVDVYVLGGGNNLVVSDAGVRGLVLEIATTGIELADESGDDVLVTAAAGEPWDPFVQRTVAANLAGLECLSGIPGRVGASPIQNVGAYGQEVADTITAVRVFDRHQRRIVTLAAKECAFGYRDSRFKSADPNRFVVLAVSYRLKRGGPPRIRYPELERRVKEPSLAGVRETVLSIRREKSMVIDPADPNRRSCGSFFVNPIVDRAELAEVERRAADPNLPRYPQADGRTKLSAAWLIEHAGLHKGLREGDVGLSTKHTLALVCHDGARASDVIAFARRIRRRVQERFGVELVPEPRFWGFASLDHGLPDERLA